jgi:hypothetical protein
MDIKAAAEYMGRTPGGIRGLIQSKVLACCKIDDRAHIVKATWIESSSGPRPDSCCTVHRHNGYKNGARGEIDMARFSPEPMTRLCVRRSTGSQTR